MSCLPYLTSREFSACRIRETVTLIRPAPENASRLCDHGDDEIARIRSVLQKVTALRVQNDHDAEDLVQETLLTMISKYPQQSLEKGLLIWGMGILRKKVGNYYRRSRRYVPIDEGDVILNHSRSCPSSVRGAESRLHFSELRTLIRHILADFPAKERRVMELQMAGFKIGEMVKQLEPERYQNIANRLFRGRKRLARKLRRYGYPIRL